MKAFEIDSEQWEQIALFEMDQNHLSMWKGKYVVWQNANTRVTVDDPDNATYAALWSADEQLVGYIRTKREGYAYLSVVEEQLNPRFSGKGYDVALLKSLLAHISGKWKGLCKQMPSNHNGSIPRTWQAIGAKFSAQYHLVYADK